MADDFRRGIQVTLAITGEPEAAIMRSTSILEMAQANLGKAAAPGGGAPRRRAPIGIPEGEVPERRPFPGIGPFP